MEVGSYGFLLSSAAPTQIARGYANERTRRV